MNVECHGDLNSTTADFFSPLELTKTLIITGLNEKTTAETLKNAFEGAASARVIVDKKTNVSKRWIYKVFFYFHTNTWIFFSSL